MVDIPDFQSKPASTAVDLTDHRTAVYVGEGRIVWILPEFPTWNFDLNGRSIVLFHVGGRLFPSSKYNGM